MGPLAPTAAYCLEQNRRIPVRRGGVDVVTLHEELLAILEAQGNDWMSVDDLAAAVNARGRYAKRDGSPVEPEQIHLRTRAGGSYERLFKREGRLVQARAADTPGPSADRDAPLPPRSTPAARTSPTPAAKSGAADAIGSAPFNRAALLVAFADASDALFGLVLPVPAPAMTTSGPSPYSTMARCSGVSGGRSSVLAAACAMAIADPPLLPAVRQ